MPSLPERRRCGTPAAVAGLCGAADGCSTAPATSAPAAAAAAAVAASAHSCCQHALLQMLHAAGLPARARLLNRAACSTLSARASLNSQLSMDPACLVLDAYTTSWQIVNVRACAGRMPSGASLLTQREKIDMLDVSLMCIWLMQLTNVGRGTGRCQRSKERKAIRTAVELAVQLQRLRHTAAPQRHAA